MNSSVLRCGRLILSQLTEATQSHQVDIQKLKPSNLKSLTKAKSNLIHLVSELLRLYDMNSCLVDVVCTDENEMESHGFSHALNISKNG